MSLRDAVAEVAREMKEATEGKRLNAWATAIRGWVKQLEISLKASEGETPLASGNAPGMPLLLPEVQHRDMIEKAKAEFRGRSKPTEDALANIESVEPRMVVCEDGPEQGTSAPIPPSMPPGARCFVGAAVYELTEEGRLKHVPPVDPVTGVPLEKR